MRYLFFLICSLFTLLSLSQDVFPFTTNLGFFKSFENGYEKQLDFLAPTEVKFSEKLIVYKDHKRDLFVYNILTIFYLVTIRMSIETPIETHPRRCQNRKF